jgi:hypothetical protein
VYFIAPRTRKPPTCSCTLVNEEESWKAPWKKSLRDAPVSEAKA